MRVLVTGATGVIGRQLTHLLAAAGHEVVALARHPEAADVVAGLGGRVVIGDLLDEEQTRLAVATVRPEAIVHMATSIPRAIDPRHLAADLVPTNLLRTVGTHHLLSAAADLGVGRFVVQGLAYAYDPGAGPATEGDPLWQNPPRQFAMVLEALRQLESLTLRAGGVVLRLGHLAGPGSIYAADGSFAEQVRAGRVPLVGGGTAVFSSAHAHDVATAVVAALDHPVGGVLNIVDDDPVPMSEWLPVYARALHAPAPRRVPAAIARLAVGGWGVAFTTRLRGADNSLARAELDWKPRYESWRASLLDGLH